MEKDFLLYLLYATLIGIRERSYESKDELTFRLCNLVHNIPLQLRSEENAIIAYNKLCEDVKYLAMDNWLNIRKEEFYSMYPNHKDDNQSNP
jgi:hypothetical protein